MEPLSNTSRAFFIRMMLSELTDADLEAIFLALAPRMNAVALSTARALWIDAKGTTVTNRRAEILEDPTSRTEYLRSRRLQHTPDREDHT